MKVEDDMTFLDREEENHPPTKELILEYAFEAWWIENYGECKPFYKPVVKKGFIAAVKWATIDDLGNIPF